jgi:hypothetical protein
MATKKIVFLCMKRDFIAYIADKINSQLVSSYLENYRIASNLEKQQQELDLRNV